MCDLPVNVPNWDPMVFWSGECWAILICQAPSSRGMRIAVIRYFIYPRSKPRSQGLAVHFVTVWAKRRCKRVSLVQYQWNEWWWGLLCDCACCCVGYCALCVVSTSAVPFYHFNTTNQANSMSIGTVYNHRTSVHLSSTVSQTDRIVRNCPNL